MTPDPEVLTAEVEGIVRELARDPRSTLLRVPRTRGVATLFSGQRRFDPDYTGLLAAERELVRVHREEIARLLRQAATHRLIDDPNPKYHITRFISPTQRRAPLNRRLFDADALDLTAPARDIAGHAVFDALLGHDIANWPSVLELTTLAQRFVATDQGRILAGIALVTDDQPDLALRILLEVAHRRATGPVAANAYANAAFAYAAAGDSNGRLSAYRESVELGENSGMSALHWLLSALLYDEPSQANEAADHVSQQLDDEDAIFEEYVPRQRAEITLIERDQFRSAHALCRRLFDRWQPSARKVIRVFET